MGTVLSLLPNKRFDFKTTASRRQKLKPASVSRHTPSGIPYSPYVLASHYFGITLLTYLFQNLS